LTNILLVEDNEMNRNMLSRWLKRKGFIMTMAVDGDEGINMARKVSPDLILMDMSLPGTDGWQASKILKSDPATSAIPILGLSAHAMDAEREKALQAGCDDYDTKPIDIKRLLGKINALLSKDKADPQ
jgi:CheY-like chemotaxis protein